MNTKNIFIVIAAYNEGKSIKHVLSGLKKAGYKNIVVVDDGSRDNTFDIVSQEGVFALRHVVNRGQGAALKTGIEFALRNGAKYIVTFDADGQHRVEDLPVMLKPIMNGECEVTLGSRFLRKVEMPWFRRFTLKIAILVIWIFYGVKMTDAHNGLRVMSRKAAQQITITSDRMEHASQIVEEINKKKIRYKEIPVVIQYTQYTLQHGTGSFLQAIKVFTRMILRRILH